MVEAENLQTPGTMPAAEVVRSQLLTLLRLVAREVARRLAADTPGSKAAKRPKQPGHEGDEEAELPQ